MDGTSLRDLMLLCAGKGGGGSAALTGTFATNNASTYTFDFGKTLDRYFYLIEMTDDAKNALMQSGESSAKMYAMYGVYPMPAMGESAPAANMISVRVNPSTSELSVSASTSITISGSAITMSNNSFSNGANVWYKNQTYKYTLIPF